LLLLLLPLLPAAAAAANNNNNNNNKNNNNKNKNKNNNNNNKNNNNNNNNDDDDDINNNTLRAPQNTHTHARTTPQGIHCLNDGLTSQVPRGAKFKIVISPCTQLRLNNFEWVPNSTVRLLRRIVRDYLTRGRSGERSLNQWPSVLGGEFRNIFPHQRDADAVMNSSTPCVRACVRASARVHANCRFFACVRCGRECVRARYCAAAAASAAAAVATAAAAAAAAVVVAAAAAVVAVGALSPLLHCFRRVCALWWWRWWWL
jgi:hypothetical protein